MQLLLNYMPLFKILAVFAAMLIGIRCKCGLGNAILGGGLLLGLVFGMSPAALAQSALEGLGNEKTAYLAAIVGFILVLSDLLDKTGQAQRVMQAVSGYLRHPRLRLAFFPALIGLLPMPGGAVFSAPMVKSIAEGMDIEDVDKVVINYWFRHLWEYCWPLYPGLILAASLGDMPIINLAIHGIPGTLAAIGVGWWFILRPKALTLATPPIPLNAPTASNSLGYTLVQGLPLLIGIVGALALEGVIAAVAPGFSYELGVVAALAAAVIVCAAQNSFPVRRLGALFVSKHLMRMLYVIVAIFIFKEILQNTGAIAELARLAGGGAALVASAVILPYLAGMVGGIAVGFVGATFPLILGMLDQLGLQHQTLAYLVLGMFSGLAGVMTSPLHICFILTCQYFNVGLGRAWRKIMTPSAIVLAVGVAYFYILR
ncbi:MAG: DUF401 family protein [Desulfovibrionaceae bacterium]